MANPFLVLGGIAVGVITAAFGILQVPGWVASAQDASAINDLSMIAAAQAASASQKGEYAGEFDQLTDGHLGLSFTVPSERVQHFAANADGWCSVVASDSGRYFAASDTLVSAVGAETVAAAISGACGPGAPEEPSGPGTGEPANPDAGSSETTPTPSVPTVTLASSVEIGANPKEVVFTPDSSTAYVIQIAAKAFTVVDVATTTTKKIVTPATVNEVAVSPDGKYVAVGGDFNVFVYGTADHTLIKSLATTSFEDVAWTADSSKLVIARKPGTMAQIDVVGVHTWAVERSVKVATGTMPTLVALADNRIVLTSSSLDVYAIDASTGTAEKLLPFKTNTPWAAAASTDGTLWMLSDKNFAHFDPATNTQLSNMTLPVGAVSVALSQDSRWAYLLSADVLLVVDTQEQAVVKQISMDNRSGASAASSPDGKVTYVVHGITSTSMSVLR